MRIRAESYRCLNREMSDTDCTATRDDVTKHGAYLSMTRVIHSPTRSGEGKGGTSHSAVVYGSTIIGRMDDVSDKAC